jgi:flavin-dependent dehydrogenase
VLVGDQPTEAPRPGESLNAEGSLEIARQFPDLAQFFADKQRLTLFFGGHALSFDSLQFEAGRSYYSLLGYPATVQLRHVDRIGFDPALFDAAIADPHCIHLDGKAAALDYQAATDRITGVLLASGKAIVSTYVFDATNQARFVARQLGVPLHRIGTPRRVVFAHYRAAATTTAPPPLWLHATSLLRLDVSKDQVEGLAWCIPVGGYVSVGISVDPEQAGANPELLLDWVDQAYSRRGVDLRAAFPGRGAPVDLRHDHYNHQRCFGRNWLLAGTSCCQFWFPSAAGVATGLVAARLAPDVLKAPVQVPRTYWEYINQVSASHSGLEWLVTDDPWSVTFEELQRRTQAMIAGNLTRLGSYLALHDAPPELAFGDAVWRLFESDRRRANPVSFDTALPQSQATLLFAQEGVPDPWTDSPIKVLVLVKPDKLEGPPAILGLIDMLSGRLGTDASAGLVTSDVKLQIDTFQLQGVAQWNAWVELLRGSPRVTNLELVPGSLTGSGAQWVLTAQWQGMMRGQASVSPQLSMTLVMASDRVAEIQTERADVTFVTGDSILPPAAFAAVVGELAAVTTA